MEEYLFKFYEEDVSRLGLPAPQAAEVGFVLIKIQHQRSHHVSGGRGK